MAANIIHVLGASGSGTTTLGQAIAKAWGYAHFDTDDYYWVPTDPMFQQNRPPAERLRLLQRDISAHPRCVISGAFEMCIRDSLHSVVPSAAVFGAGFSSRER